VNQAAEELDAYLLQFKHGVLLQFTNYLLFITAKAGVLTMVVVSSCFCGGYGTPGAIRTPDPLLRRSAAATHSIHFLYSFHRFTCFRGICFRFKRIPFRAVLT
jgi:hypothetical protein